MATFTQMKDDLKTCPYNPLHRVAARRLQQHIVKCSKNPANPVLMDCPFNALHKIAPQELQQHILSCKDSRQVIREIEEKRNQTVPINRPVVFRSENPISSENWDEEMDSQTKPKTYVIPGLVAEEDNKDGKDDEVKPFKIKSNIEVQCMKPADRKKYYKELTDNTKLKQKADQESQHNPSVKQTPQTNRSPQVSNASSSSPQTSEVKSESDDSTAVRRPHTNPFKAKPVGGIGRGNTPTVNRMAVNRTVGISRESLDSNIKRERSDDDLKGLKRFSPDLN